MFIDVKITRSNIFIDDRNRKMGYILIVIRTLTGGYSKTARLTG